MTSIPVRHQRQLFLADHLDPRRLSILEIGAFDSPTWIGEDTPKDLRFLDWFSTEELFAMHDRNPARNPERRIEVDYVVKDKHFSRHVPQRFDLVVANHVIEHIADPIAWLQEAAAVTVDGGHLCVAIPDRRYTFDYLRAESTAVDMVRAHQAGLRQPDYWQALASIFMYRPIKAQDCWPGPPPAEKLRAARLTLAQAMAQARRAEHEYVDCHCHVFSQPTFASLLSDLREAGLVPWRLVALRGVLEHGNEFLALLGKDAGATPTPTRARPADAGAPRPTGLSLRDRLRLGLA